jgi:hypothetical protein
MAATLCWPLERSFSLRFCDDENPKYETSAPVSSVKSQEPVKNGKKEHEHHPAIFLVDIATCSETGSELKIDDCTSSTQDKENGGYYSRYRFVATMKKLD